MGLPAEGKHRLDQIWYFEAPEGPCLASHAQKAQATGRMEVKTVTPQQITLQTRGGGPHPTEIELVFASDELTKAQMVMQERVDLSLDVHTLPKTRTLMQRTSAKWNWRVFPGDALQYLGFSLRGQHFSSPEIRHAFAAALPIETLLKTRYKDFVERRNSYFGTLGGPTQSLGSNGLPSLPADFPRTWTLVTSTQREAIELMQIYAASLRSSGIFDSVAVRSLESGTLLSRIQMGQIPLYISRWIQPPSFEHLRRIAHSKGDLNRSGLADPEIDRAIDQGVLLESQQGRSRSPTQNLHQLQAEFDLKFTSRLPYQFLWVWSHTLAYRVGAFSLSQRSCLDKLNQRTLKYLDVVNCLL